MLLKRVVQKHRNGCFIAAAACALGVSYDEVRERMFPKQIAAGKPFLHALPGGRSAVSVLRKLGLNAHATWDRNIREMKKPAFLMVEWADEDNRGRGHCLVWDPKKKVIHDPAWKRPLSFYDYESQLSVVIYFSR